MKRRTRSPSRKAFGANVPRRFGGSVPTPRRPARQSRSALADRYLDFVHEQPCAVTWGNDCAGDIEAHHYGERGKSLKCSDFQTVALCTFHHRRWDAAGELAPFGPLETRELFYRWESEHQAQFLEAMAA